MLQWTEHRKTMNSCSSKQLIKKAKNPCDMLVLAEQNDMVLRVKVKGHCAEGHMEALKEELTDTIGLSTDGENKNVVKHKGLLRLIDNEGKNQGVQFPMLKSVCAVHSSALAFKYVCKVVGEVDVLFRKLYGISTYFHASAARTSEREEVAKELSFRVRRLPKLDGQSLQLP